MYVDSNQANKGREWGRGKIITETRQDENKWDTILIEWGEGGRGRGRHELKVHFGGVVARGAVLLGSFWGVWVERV
jgi:hypothetical protein